MTSIKRHYQTWWPIALRSGQPKTLKIFVNAPRWNYLSITLSNSVPPILGIPRAPSPSRAVAHQLCRPTVITPQLNTEHSLEFLLLRCKKFVQINEDDDDVILRCCCCCVQTPIQSSTSFIIGWTTRSATTKRCSCRSSRLKGSESSQKWSRSVQVSLLLNNRLNDSNTCRQWSSQHEAYGRNALRNSKGHYSK